jgi:hypothetical protein
MTAEADFTAQQWKQILEGPTSAGMIVITSQRGGTVRETFSMAKAYGEARRRHGQSELLDAIVATKPELDRTRTGSLDELKTRNLGHIRAAVAVLESKAGADELDEYRRFVLALAETVAAAHRESGRDGDPVSDAERAAIGEIAEALS